MAKHPGSSPRRRRRDSRFSCSGSSPRTIESWSSCKKVSPGRKSGRPLRC
jgi:hypothetical protein